MKNIFLWSFVLCLFLSPQLSWAKTKILFEGYYKVLLQAQHVGYYIQRYEIDAKKKQIHIDTLSSDKQKGRRYS